MLIDFGREKEVPERELILGYLEFIDDVLDELGSREEIGYVHELLKNGTGADRQLRVFEETKDLRRVVEYMAARRSSGGMTSNLLKQPFDPELTPGARSAVRVCLAIAPAEKVTLITDEACREIAASLAREVADVGAPCHAFVLEDVAPRPLVELAAAIAADMETSQVSILAVQVQTHELRSRMQADRYREPPPHAPRPHGEHQPADHDGGDARRFSQGRPDQHARTGARRARDRCARSRPAAIWWPTSIRAIGG